MTGACYYCGCYHEGVCGRVQSIEYHPDGTVKKVTFHADAPLVQLGGLHFGHPSPPAGSPRDET